MIVVVVGVVSLLVQVFVVQLFVAQLIQKHDHDHDVQPEVMPGC